MDKKDNLLYLPAIHLNDLTTDYSRRILQQFVLFVHLQVLLYSVVSPF